MPDFRRPHHRVVARLLRALDASFLAQAECYFGGGTQLTMAFGEYRESRDVDFLCSSRGGFRLIREAVDERSLGRIATADLTLAREVRADRDAVRTFVTIDAATLKFEVLLEGRIDLAGAMDRKLGVPTLSIEHAIAEKLLANTDRGLDDATLSRDLIDLAFIAIKVDKNALRAGFALAEQAYGSSVTRSLRRCLDLFRDDRARAKRCAGALAVNDTTSMRKGLRILRTLLD